MEIREFLGLHSSRINADILVDKIEEDPNIFDTVWGIMLEDADPVSMRAAWSIMIFAEKHPYFLEPRIPEIVKILPGVKSAGVRRCLLKVISLLPIPKKQSGIIFDYCFDIIESPSAEIAPKAYAMTILYTISQMEPDLKPELMALLESQLDEESAGVRARASILLTKLYKDLALPG